MNPLYPDVAQRAGHRCEYCHAPEAVFNFEFEVEHIIPKSLGGANSDDNLALACHACNRLKSNSTTFLDPESGQEVRLFHPREDRWEHHFSVDSLGAVIVGNTPIGRATVAQLKMNRDLQIEARRIWLQLGLFPERSSE
jgi:hypothetical protein